MKCFECKNNMTSETLRFFELFGYDVKSSNDDDVAMQYNCLALCMCAMCDQLRTSCLALPVGYLNARQSKRQMAVGSAATCSTEAGDVATCVVAWCV